VNLITLAAIVVVATLGALAVLWAARRSPLNERFVGEVGEHNKAFDFIGTAFAVLLAFVVIQAYDNYNDAKSGAETEAVALLEQARTVEAFDPEVHARLEGLLVCYGRAVIHHGWPAMRDEQEGDPIVNDWGAAFRTASLNADPRSWVQRESFRQLLMEQDLRIEGRRSRLAEAVREVPAPLWIVMLLGAALTIGWVILSASRRGSFLVQASVVASVAAMISAVLLLVWFLDHPFADEPGSITPIEMEHALETIAHEAERQGVEVNPPCNEAGDPEPV
jgi:hypothetical protein